VCGIGGYHVGPGAPPGRPVLAAMADSLLHRGPDDVGLFEDGPVGLAVRRLSIIDLAGGHQPISSEDGSLTVVLNGEIYNYAELGRELRARGHTLRTGADTEVIVHLYEELGDRCVDRLRGMFAFALWDARRGRLLLARDRLGIKPLYVARLPGGGIGFASEIKALFALPGVRREICPTALGRYLDVLYTAGRETIFEGITRLPPGCILSVDAERTVERPYWDVRPDGPAGRASLDENAARLRAELDEAVRLHMVADVPVGALLSGGLDSSVVVALAARASSQPLKTYTVAFDVGELSEKYDERPQARLVADRYGTDHTEVMLTGGELARLFPAATWHLDEPFGNPTAIATYVVSREARRAVKVVLSGDGGDELFGGYLRYAYDRAVSLYGMIPGPARAAFVRPALRAMRRVGALKLNLTKLEQPADVERYAAWHFTTPPGTREELLTPEWRERTAAGRIQTVFAEHLAAAPRPGFQERMMYADLRSWIPDQSLMQSDKMSMMASLELRVPLLDHRIVELAAGVPFDQKVRLWPLQTKRLVKRAFADLLPPEILTQRKKGFFAPAGKWLRTELRDMAIDLLSPERLDRQGIFRSEVVQRMLTTHLERRGYFGHELWTLMSFQLWHDTFMGAGAPTGPVSAVRQTTR
jgi:asparagine synthase (glutamine-hydrolysing)